MSLYVLNANYGDSLPGFETVGELLDGSIVVRSSGEADLPRDAQLLPHPLPAPLWDQIVASSPAALRLRQQLQDLIRSRYSQADEIKFSRLSGDKTALTDAQREELSQYGDFIASRLSWYKGELARLGIEKEAEKPKSQFDRDQTRYTRRAAVKDELIAWMAADNMSRVRSGVWSVGDLQALVVELAPINAMMQTLSYELAAQAIASVTNPLMTAEIKAAWVAKLTEHFYLGA